MLFFKYNILRVSLSVIIFWGILFSLMGSQPIDFPHLKGKFAPERVGTKLSERYWHRSICCMRKQFIMPRFARGMEL